MNELNDSRFIQNWSVPGVFVDYTLSVAMKEIEIGTDFEINGIFK